MITYYEILMTSLYRGFCKLLNPDDQAAQRGPGPRYILDDD